MKSSKAKPEIQIKRIYDAPGAEDGTRILVDRLWPRGIAKAKAHIDEWFKDLAPSTELRTWFGHLPSRWTEFQRRYGRELHAQPDLIAKLASLSKKETVTLIYAAKDELHNNAMALKNYLARIGHP